MTDIIDWLDAQGTKEHHVARDEIIRLRKENAAQLAELTAISTALGTSEGHSSVRWIERLRKIEAAATDAIDVNEWYKSDWNDSMYALEAALKED